MMIYLSDNVPLDWESPNFEARDKVHDWKNYISDRCAGMWDFFTDEQKHVISSMLQDIADREEWD